MRRNWSRQEMGDRLAGTGSAEVLASQVVRSWEQVDRPEHHLEAGSGVAWGWRAGEDEELDTKGESLVEKFGLPSAGSRKPPRVSNLTSSPSNLCWTKVTLNMEGGEGQDWGLGGQLGG